LCLVPRREQAALACSTVGQEHRRKVRRLSSEPPHRISSDYRADRFRINPVCILVPEQRYDVKLIVPNWLVESSFALVNLHPPRHRAKGARPLPQIRLRWRHQDYRRQPEGRLHWAGASDRPT
jgi:hypothetical protein